MKALNSGNEERELPPGRVVMQRKHGEEQESLDRRDLPRIESERSEQVIYVSTLGMPCGYTQNSNTPGLNSATWKRSATIRS